MHETASVARTVPGLRLVEAVLAAIGLAIAVWLALMELGLAATWDPLFGGGTDRVLTSSLSRALPVPDAALGALGYAAEAVLALVGGADRTTHRPDLVLVFGAVAGLMAATGLTLAAIQVIGLRTGCTLCLTSCGLSLAIAALAVPDVREALDQRRRNAEVAR